MGRRFRGLYSPFYVLAKLFQLEFRPKLEALDLKKISKNSAFEASMMRT